MNTMPKRDETPIKAQATMRPEPDSAREVPNAPMKKVKYVSPGVVPGTGRNLFGSS